MAKAHSITRRAAFAGAVALAAVPAVASETDADIHALWREWQGLQAEYDAIPDEVDSSAYDPINVRMRDLECRAARTKPQTAAGVAIVVMIITSGGHFTIADEDIRFIDHMNALIAA